MLLTAFTNLAAVVFSCPSEAPASRRRAYDADGLMDNTAPCWQEHGVLNDGWRMTGRL
jgi:hypothetical protein